MHYRILGKTGLNVSEIGLGASELGRPEVSDAQAERVLNAALDLGINLVDTAAMYKLSEDRIGRHLHRRRDEFILATKCGDYNVLEEGRFRIVKDYSPDGILRTIDRSRQTLRTDVIDIVQFHGLPPVGAAREAAFAALVKARDRGWTRFIGVSADELLTDEETARWPIDTQEFTYNILHQEAARAMLPGLARRHVGTIIKQPIANAVYLLGARPEGTYYAKSWDRAQRLNVRELAADMPLVEFALRFTLSQPGVHTAIAGTTNPANLEANARVSDGRALDPQIRERAERRFQEAFGGGT